jgi:hypothetical protein
VSDRGDDVGDRLRLPERTTVRELPEHLTGLLAVGLERRKLAVQVGDALMGDRRRAK